MTDFNGQAAPAATATALPGVVDLDAGGSYGRETIALARPFKFKGATYTEVNLRVPTGLDLRKHMDARTGRISGIGLMCDLAELSEDVFDAMYLGDRQKVDNAVGKHLSGGPSTSTT